MVDSHKEHNYDHPHHQHCHVHKLLNPPNQEFFIKYGELDEKNSAIHKSQVLLFRHGLSRFNFAMDAMQEENALVQDKQEKHKNHVKLTSNPDFIDALLHEEGISQAQDQQDLFNLFTFRKIFVSPLRRAIMTATSALDKHPQKEKLSLTLLPLAKEIQSSIDNVAVDHSDLIKFTNQIQQEMGFNFDYQHFEQYAKSDNIDTWYIQTLTNEQKRDMILEKCKNEHHHKVMQKVIEDLNGERLEPFGELLERAKILRKFINNEIEKEVETNGPFKPNEKILMVGHVRIITTFFADKMDHDGFPNWPIRWVNNCELIPYHYEDLHPHPQIHENHQSGKHDSNTHGQHHGAHGHHHHKKH